MLEFIKDVISREKTKNHYLLEIKYMHGDANMDEVRKFKIYSDDRKSNHKIFEAYIRIMDAADKKIKKLESKKDYNNAIDIERNLTEFARENKDLKIVTDYLDSIFDEEFYTLDIGDQTCDGCNFASYQGYKVFIVEGREKYGTTIKFHPLDESEWQPFDNDTEDFDSYKWEGWESKSKE